MNKRTYFETHCGLFSYQGLCPQRNKAGQHEAVSGRVGLTRSLCVFVSLQPTLVQDMTEFKRSLPLFPLAKPHINFMAAKL